MKISRLYICVALAAAAAFCSCDDGKIYPKNEDLSGDNGFTVLMKGNISGALASYEPGLTLVLAAFNEGNEYAVSTKNVGNGSDDVALTNVSTSVKTVELCLINSLRKRIFTLVSEDVSATSGESVSFEIGDVDASTFSVMQTAVFNKTCSQCHGATGHAAASLSLLPGEAFGNLVGVPSQVVAGELRVSPGNANASTLWQALATDDSEKWSFDHSNLLDEEKSSFIGSWINKLN